MAVSEQQKQKAKDRYKSLHDDYKALVSGSGPSSSGSTKTPTGGTPVTAYDKTGAVIPGAYVLNGKTYYGSGTPVSIGTRTIDTSGTEWKKTANGGVATGNQYGLQGGDYNAGSGNTNPITSNEYYDRYLKAQQDGIQSRIDASVAANNAYIPQINQQSDKALQDAYILREQNRVNAPQALSALGYTGGATETGLMGIQIGYENSRNQIEQNRAQSLDKIRQNEQQIRATGDATLSEAAADYYNKLIAAQQQAAAQAQSQANWEAEFALRQQQYADAAAQQAWQNQYDERLYELQRANAGKSSGSGSKTYGGMTVSQINDLVLSGVMSEDQARSLLGLPVSEEKVDSGNVYSTVERLLLQRTVPSSQRALIEQYNVSGQLTDEQAAYLLRKYGL